MFKQRLLEHALEDAGLPSLAGQEANLYRLLTDDEVSSTTQTRVGRQLEREGIDVDALDDDFVSYQAIQTYLQNYRDASYESDTDPIEQAQTTITQHRNRFVTVTESKLDRVEQTETFGLGNTEVTVDVRAYCRD